MAVTMKQTGWGEIAITGVDLSIATWAEWNVAINEVASWLQFSKIATAYSKQEVAAGSLGRNNPAYTRWKIKKGWDRKRGHKTNFTQNTLRSRRLWNVRTGPNWARIVFDEAKFHSIVDYIVHYENMPNKVPGQRILQVNGAWVRQAQDRLRAWEARQRAKPINQKIAAPNAGLARALAAQRAALSGAARRRIGGLIGRAVQGFREPVAPTPIKSDFKFVNNLAKEAAKLLKQSK